MDRFLGYTNKATLFTFEVNGIPTVVTSNAMNFEDARDKAGLSKEARLISSASYKLEGVKNAGNGQTKTIWSVVGVVPSGKEIATYLLEKGLMSKEEVKLIFGADEHRFIG